jgi:hypothetical protein
MSVRVEQDRYVNYDTSVQTLEAHDQSPFTKQYFNKSAIKPSSPPVFE